MTAENDRYAKLFASWGGHPKVLAVGFEGMGLLSWAMSYCAERRSGCADGYVPQAALPNLPGLQRAVKTLLEAGLFETAPNGYVVHDWLDWQPSRAELAQKRAQANARQTRYVTRQQERQLTINGAVT